MNLEKLKFPIGEYISKPSLSPEEHAQRIEDIASFPDRVNALVEGLSVEALNSVPKDGQSNKLFIIALHERTHSFQVSSHGG
ncbi:MAG: hypothetical protein AAF740_09560 [Bacteroidota bacterium]